MMGWTNLHKPTGGSEVAGPRDDSADAVVNSQREKVLEEFQNIFTKNPGQTSLAQHRIDAGLSPPMCCKLRPINSQKQTIMNACINDLLSQGLVRQGQSTGVGGHEVWGLPSCSVFSATELLHERSRLPYASYRLVARTVTAVMVVLESLSITGVPSNSCV